MGKADAVIAILDKLPLREMITQAPALIGAIEARRKSLAESTKDHGVEIKAAQMEIASAEDAEKNIQAASKDMKKLEQLMQKVESLAEQPGSGGPRLAEAQRELHAYIRDTMSHLKHAEVDEERIKKLSRIEAHAAQDSESVE